MKSVIAPFLIFFILSIPVFSQTANTYIGSDGGNWNNNSNWDEGIPDIGHDVLIWGNKTVLIDINNAICNTLQLGKPGNPRVSGTGSISFSPNSRLDIADTIIIGQGNRTGSISLGDNGYLSASSFIIGNAGSWDHGTGTIEIKGESLPDIWMLTFHNLTINSESDVMLTAPITVTNNLTFLSGSLITGGYLLSLTSTGNIVDETDDSYLIGNVNVTRFVGTGASDFGDVGVSIEEGADELGDVTVLRISGPAGVISANDNEGIARHWVITNTGVQNFASREISFSWQSADDNGHIFGAAQLYKSINDTTWITVGGPQNVGPLNPRQLNANTTSFSMWTAAELSAPLPVELSSFIALAQTNAVILNWKTATEVMNYGFDIERKNGNNWEKIGFVEGHGNSNSVKSYSFTDKNILAGKSYSYRLKQLDTDGKYEYSQIVEVTLKAPEQYTLMQNHPNPFNPTTTIVYSIPQAGNVSLKIYDIIGNQVAELVNEKQAEGSYEVSFNASNFPSGMYLYRLETDAFSAVKKMLLVK